LPTVDAFADGETIDPDVVDGFGECRLGMVIGKVPNKASLRLPILRRQYWIQTDAIQFRTVGLWAVHASIGDARDGTRPTASQPEEIGAL
jgi:hypothetical protein